MKRYLNYLKYVLIHKYYVTVECFKRGLYWRGLIHDYDKFFPNMFITYAKYFYNEDGSNINRRDATGHYNPSETDGPFEYSLFTHVTRHKHHWQWWVLPQEDGTFKLFEMDKTTIIEMICDWIGAGKAQGTPPCTFWWEKNKDKLHLHENTRQYIEDNLERIVNNERR